MNRKVQIPMIELPDEGGWDQPIWQPIMMLRDLQRDEKRWREYQAVLKRDQADRERRSVI